jgi:mannosyltransferase
MATNEIAQLAARTGNLRRFWGSLIATLTPIRLLAVITLLGGLVRFYRYDALSLWLDEGITVHMVRLPWLTVLGFNGAYETHPPLYFVLVKLATLIVPEVNAGRIVSLIAGIVTIPALYALAARLLNRWAALLAAGVVAISPIHIWYSQEARMYTLTVLLVCVSYLALVAFQQSRRLAWAGAYGVSLLLAVYADYSAIYALAPQVLLLMLITRRLGRKSFPLWGAGVAAVLGYLPWLPQLLGTMQIYGDQRSSYLGVTPVKIGISLVSLIGAGGNAANTGVPNGGYFWGFKWTAWDFGLAAQTAIVLSVAIMLVASIPRLARRAPMALLVAALCLGTIVVTALLSLISPGYAERTVLPALLGWAIVVGGAGLVFASGDRSRLWLRIAGFMCIGIILAASLVSLRAVYRGALKQDWRQLAADTNTAAATGKLIITYPTFAETLISAYQPHAVDGRYIPIDDGELLPALMKPGESEVDALWLAYMEYGRIEEIRGQLEALGFVRLSHKYYPDPLFLDYYELSELQP